MRQAGATYEPVADHDARRVCDWIEQATGGRVVGLWPLARWRHGWTVDVAAEGRTLALYVRGDRTEGAFGPYPLDYEFRVQRLMESRGIPVPHVYGFCEDPPAIVMERVPGGHDLREVPERVRATVVAEYVEVLARMHSLDPADFAAAGVAWPEPDAVALAGFARMEDRYLANKRQADPWLEFARHWVRRQLAGRRCPPAPIFWDAGQLLHHDGHLTAVLDLETVHLGDPAMDLAALRMRDAVVGFGDFPALVEAYRSASGTDMDPSVIDLQTIAFCLTNQLGTHRALAAPETSDDYMTYLCWCTETNLWATELMAERLGVELEPLELPPPAPSRRGAAHRQLTALAERQFSDAAPGAGRYEARARHRLARHLCRADEIGEQLDRGDAGDVAAVLGATARSWEDSDVALERFVLESGPEAERDLVTLFNRRFQRQLMLLGPPGSPITSHARLQPVHA